MWFNERVYNAYRYARTCTCTCLTSVTLSATSIQFHYSNNQLHDFKRYSKLSNESNTSLELVISQVENFSCTDTSKCVNVVDELVGKPVDKPLFWYLYFDGSKSNDGA